NINSERIITMLNVVDNTLVLEEKGIYSIEKFLVARRLMYWQVYLHKTPLAAEQLLIRILKRAKELHHSSYKLHANKSLLYFLDHQVGIAQFDSEVLQVFSKLDDIDILSAMKVWSEEEDFVLSHLCRMLLNRNLLKIKVRKKSVKNSLKETHLQNLMTTYNLSRAEAEYFVFTGVIENQAYNLDAHNIHILMNTGKIKDVTKASDQFNLKALSKPVTKYFMCYPKK